MRFAFLVIAVASASVAVSGCRSVMDPTAMPAGYAYHQNLHKSPPGPPASDIGYPFSQARNDVVIEKWQVVAHTLVSGMEAELGLQPQPVYVDTLPQHNAFNATFDYVLREELRSRGYTLVSVPGPVVHLRPEAYLAEDLKLPVDANRYNGDLKIDLIPENREKARNFKVGIDLLQNGVAKGRVDGDFLLPAYGYVRGEGQDHDWNRNCKKTGKAAACAKQDAKEQVRRVPDAAPDYRGNYGADITADPGAPEPLVPAVPGEVTQEPL